jgi:Spy/CpxP family protein refolding chaperone
MKKIILFVVLISAVTLFSFWGGKKVCMMMWPGSINPNQSWYYSFGLTAEQEASLKKMDASFRKDGDKLCMQICKGRLDLLNLIKEKNPNEARVHQKIEEIGQMQILLEKTIADHIIEVKKGLTPAQSEAYLDRVHQEITRSIEKSGYSEALKQ